VDLLFSDPLVHLLAGGKLRADTYYRANRCDVPDAIDPEWDISRQLAWCQGHTLRRLGRDPRYRAFNLELVGLQDKPHYKKWVFDKVARLQGLFWTPEKRALYQLDWTACGDFTLMSKEAWIASEGYVELDLYSLHVDSLSLVAAASLGYAQHVFPREACTYHIDHPAGWQALSPLEKVRFLEQRPTLDYSLLQEVGLHALKHRQPLGLNPPDWGFANHAFDEFVFLPGKESVPESATTGALARH
jgi:hypothetical protein